MPRLTHSVPRYRKHRRSGQAIVSISGQDHYLGPYGTRASKVEYDRLIAEWLAGNRYPLLSQEEQARFTVSEVAARYLAFARQHYRKDGKATSSLDAVKQALRPLRRLYGRTPAADFGPLALKAVRLQFVQAGLCRKSVNDRVETIKRLFKWATAEQLVPPSVFQGLQTVGGLQKGRCDAPERPPVRSVPDAVVDATLPHLPAVVADMVRLQRLTGARPAEVCLLRPCDVERSGEVWEYRPARHKTEHHDQQRLILIGPQAQEILTPYLLRADDTYCFCPQDSERQRRADQHARRVTPLRCGNRPGTNRKRRPSRKPGNRYTTDSYGRAVNRAVKLANLERTKAAEEAKACGEAVELVLVPVWSPNRLRHSAATKIRKRYGLEAAQVILGHTKANVTEIYAERDTDLARRVIAEVG